MGQSHNQQWKSRKSDGNNSTTALDGDATFTGTWELNDYSDVIVTCKADVAGTLYFLTTKEQRYRPSL